MLKCPTCSGRLRCVDSRPQDKAQETRRRYECRSCRERWTSHERIDPPKIPPPLRKPKRVYELWELP